MLRSRKARRAEPLGPRVPDPVLSREVDTDPEREAMLADPHRLARLDLAVLGE